MLNTRTSLKDFVTMTETPVAPTYGHVFSKDDVDLLQKHGIAVTLFSIPR
jgi:hypothetical protein